MRELLRQVSIDDVIQSVLCQGLLLPIGNITPPVFKMLPVSSKFDIELGRSRGKTTESEYPGAGFIRRCPGGRDRRSGCQGMAAMSRASVAVVQEEYSD